MSGLFDEHNERERQARRAEQAIRSERAAEERRNRSFGGGSNANPKAECGDYTGRCGKCGSSDLWDDCTASGCNKCGMIRFTG